MQSAPDIPLRGGFLGWQCRIRQLAVRQLEGRPSPGMTPEAFAAGSAGAGVIGSAGAGENAASLGPVVVLILKQPEFSATPEFRHMVKQTHDPRQRREKALRFLASSYYQRAREFSDELTALFGPVAPGVKSSAGVADTLLAAGECRLVFREFSQGYDLTCAVRELEKGEEGFEGAYWHNSLFNPAIPAGVRVLGFQPDWPRCSALG
ncbi:MAG: hypothetical protein ACYYKD_03180 [Rhodospirillales bacterium]